MRNVLDYLTLLSHLSSMVRSWEAAWVMKIGAQLLDGMRDQVP